MRGRYVQIAMFGSPEGRVGLSVSRCRRRWGSAVPRWYGQCTSRACVVLWSGEWGAAFVVCFFKRRVPKNARFPDVGGQWGAGALRDTIVT